MPWCEFNGCRKHTSTAPELVAEEARIIHIFASTHFTVRMRWSVYVAPLWAATHVGLDYIDL